jgi:hypothetical protein
MGWGLLSLRLGEWLPSGARRPGCRLLSGLLISALASAWHLFYFADRG